LYDIEVFLFLKSDAYFILVLLMLGQAPNGNKGGVDLEMSMRLSEAKSHAEVKYSLYISKYSFLQSQP
jgi:hypothetical protein